MKIFSAAALCLLGVAGGWSMDNTPFQAEYSFNSTKPGAGTQRISIHGNKVGVSNTLNQQSDPIEKSGTLTNEQLQLLIKRLNRSGFQKLDAVYPPVSKTSAHWPAHAIRLELPGKTEKTVSTQRSDRPAAFESARQILRDAVKQAIPDIDLDTFVPGL